MRRVVPLLILGSTGLGFAGLAGGCATGAVAVTECREIEHLRCEISVACGTVDDVAACKRFYTDQCLHGIEGDKAPTAQAHKRCVESIRAAGACAEDDDATAPSDCDGVNATLVEGADAMENVCDLIGRPWELEVCAYITERSDGAGGEGGGS